MAPASGYGGDVGGEPVPVASFRESWWHRSCPSDRAPHGSLLLEAPAHDDREEAVVRLALRLRLVGTRVGVGVGVGAGVKLGLASAEP